MRLTRRSDLVAYLLVQKLGLSPISLAIYSVVLTIGSQFLVAWACDAFVSSHPDRVGLLQDPGFWIWCLVLQPVLFGYYLWSLSSLKNLIKELEDSKSIKIGDEKIKQIQNDYETPLRMFFSLIIATLSSIILTTSDQIIAKSWNSFGIIPRTITTVNFFLDTYIGSMLFLTLVFNILALQEIVSRTNLKVNPLHPDRCGGLSPLSQYSLKTAYLAAIFGIVIGFMEYYVIAVDNVKKYWFLHLTIPLFIILSITCFFGPLITAHAAMEEARKELLHEIAVQFEKDYKLIHDGLSREAEELKKDFAKINQLRSLYRLTYEFPVWPFDIKTLRRYLLSVTTPLIPILIAICQVLLKQLFNGAV